MNRGHNDENCGGALSKDGEPKVLQKLKERAPEPSFQPMGTKEFWENFMDALSAMENREGAGAQPGGKRCRKWRAMPRTRSSVTPDV